MNAALDRIELWLAPIGGLATGLLVLTGLAIVLALLVVVLVWRTARWAKTAARELRMLNEMLRTGQLKREKPEDAITRSLREREIEIVTRAAKPAKRNGPRPGDPAKDDRELQRWRAYGFDMESGMRTSVVIRAVSVAAARREAEIRGVEAVSMVERLQASDEEQPADEAVAPSAA